MKKILLVLPGCRIGGMLSSAISLLNSSFTVKYEVSVFVMSALDIEKQPIIQKYDIGHHILSTAIYANMINMTLWQKICNFPLKLLLRFPIIGSRLFDILNKWIINGIESKNDFDYVISFQESTSLPFVARFRNPNKITWIHSDYGRKSIEEDEFNLYKLFKGIVCVSDYTCRSFLERYPQLKGRVHTIYNILDVDNIINKSKNPITDCFLDNNTFSIVSVGRIDPVKRFSVIPTIAQELKTMGETFKWYIIGGIASSKEYAKIKRDINIYGLENNVILLGEKTNPYPYFQAANLLVSTSISEACPMIFNEAKVLKIPIISTDFGSAREFIEEGRDGFVVPLENLASTIYKVICDKTLYDSLNPTVGNAFSLLEIEQKIDNLFK